MKILVICSESYTTSDSPLTGAVGGIISAYRRQGAEVLGFSPFFPEFVEESDYSESQKFTEKLGYREYSVLKSTYCKDDLVIRYDDYFHRPGIYGNPGEKSYNDNYLRFSFLTSAALNYCMETKFKPDAIHVHDWSGIAGALIKTVYKDYFAGTPVLLTVHNIRYDCQSNPDEIPKIGLPQDGFDIDGYEFWGKVSLLKAAILYSDKVVFTSSGYMFYLLSTDLPGGMRGFLESQRKKLFSIQSGIDYEKWGIQGNMEELKKQSKEELKTELGLEANYSMLIYSHIDVYSGCSAQVISTLLANLLNLNLQLIIGISESDSNYPYFSAMQEKHKDRMALLPLCENVNCLHKRLIASDVFFSISTKDPSLSLFLKAAAAGSISIANKRTQEPLFYTMPYEPGSDESSTMANSFISEGDSPDLILEQVRMAESIYCNKKSLWSKLVGNTSSLRVQWDDSAKNYLLLLRGDIT